MKKNIVASITGVLLISMVQAQCIPDYNMPVRKIKLGNIHLAYISKGEGLPIIMMHGLGGNATHWQRNIESLSKNYKCIAVDLPGYGSSDKVLSNDSTAQLSFYATILLQFIEALKLKQVALMGHSMGAQVAILTALKAPEKISKLILISPAGFEIFSEADKNILKQYATPALYEQQDSAAILNSYKLNFYQMPSEAEELIKQRLALRQCNTYSLYCKAVASGVIGMLSQPVRENLPQLQQPALVMFAENDALIPNKILHPNLTTAQVAAASKEIKNSRLVIIKQAGHMVQFEKPEEVNKEVINFLKSK